MSASKLNAKDYSGKKKQDLPSKELLRSATDSFKKRCARNTWRWKLRRRGSDLKQLDSKS